MNDPNRNEGGSPVAPVATAGGPADKVGFHDRAEGVVIKNDPLWNSYPQIYTPHGERGRIHIAGVFDVECYDEHGDLKWHDIAKNALNNASINNMLDVYLFNQAQTTVWYMSLVDNAGFSAFAPTDVYATHAGWTEFTLYTGSNRIAWGNGAASGQAMTNGTQVSFSINGAGTVKGLGLWSLITKGDTAGAGGKLYSTAAFAAGNQTVANLDTLRCTYTVSGTTS